MIFEKSLSISNASLDSQNESIYELIKRFEGLRLKAYYCSAGVLTCGWGSTGKDIMPNTVWTKEYADGRFRSDVHFFIKGVRSLCPSANRSQLCALTSFAYNLGLNALKNSTLRRKFNAGDISGAKKELLRWNKAGGRVIKGLTYRREIEAKLL